MPLKPRQKTDSVWPDFFDYFRQDFRRELSGWSYVIRYYGMLTPLLILGLVALFLYVDPIPPKKAYIATGQIGSSYRMLSEKFAAYFAKHGFELVLVETPGLDQGFEKLRDDNSPVNVTFLTAGSVQGSDFPDLVSLGSVQFSPLWLFYRGPRLSGPVAIDQLLEMRSAVGMPGTNTHNILKQLLKLHGVTYQKRPNFFELPHKDAAEEFIKGNIDVMFVVDGIDAPTIQKMLAVPGVNIFDFNLIDAYVKNLQFLEKASIPRGALNIQNIFPPQDTDLLASSITLLVERSTHPVHQWLFLMAARAISDERNQFFARPGFFPAYLDRSVPLSPIADVYYKNGLPTVFRYFPLWIASLFDRAWVVLLALVAIIYPLFKAITDWRNFPSQKLLGDYFQDLREIEEDLVQAQTKDEIEQYLAEFDELEKRLMTCWFDDSQLGSYYAARMTALRNIRATAASRLAALKT